MPETAVRATYVGGFCALPNNFSANGMARSPIVDDIERSFHPVQPHEARMDMSVLKAVLLCSILEARAFHAKKTHLPDNQHCLATSCSNKTHLTLHLNG
jgi:hypothetical protein